ncbi:uncharacterized protein LOC132904318 [Amyelois transitella]|uniref:uncharacterized protein LOC132904318 n=1 Tax=Amyelois transitella TaxID=680683 RepID=UPI0029907707|nr:uncharacterized protein LOC132904318 [Amyelois transitella]
MWRAVVEAGSVRINMQRIQAEDYSPLVQCPMCLGYGHGRRHCREKVEKCCHCTVVVSTKGRTSCKQKRIEVTDIEKFTSTIENKWTEWVETKHGTTNPNVMWEKAKQLIQQAATESKTQSKAHKRQHWMTEGTLALVEERRRKKAQGADMRTINKLSAEVQAACRRDHNNYLHAICHEIESHAGSHESKDMYHKIRVITKSLPSKTWAIENSDNRVVTELVEISGTWKGYCQSLFQDPHCRDFPSTVLNTEDLEPDILLSEVRAAIKHLKNGKATGRDAIPIETIKALGDGKKIDRRPRDVVLEENAWCVLDNAVHDLTNFTISALDGKKKCLTFFLDLKKAFDTVFIPLLLEKLESIGVRDKGESEFAIAESYDLAALRRKRAAVKGVITKMHNALRDPSASELDKHALCVREERLRSSFSKWEDLRLDIIAMDPDDPEDDVEKKRALALENVERDKVVLAPKAVHVATVKKVQPASAEKKSCILFFFTLYIPNISVIPATCKQKRETCTDYKLFAANNSEIKTFGIKNLTLNLNLRRPYHWTFVIADVNQAILSADFLTHHNLIVDLNAKKLIDKETRLLTFGNIVNNNTPSIGTVNGDHPFLELLNEFPEITKPISFNNLDSKCTKNNVFHYIETTGKPIHARARPLPPDRYHKVKEFKLMQELGICRPSKSEWASPLHVVAKKNGEIRPVGDYRRLNAITKPDRYPVPRLHDFTYMLAGKKYFSKIDINKAYFFIKVAPQDIEKTAIITPIGLFEFLRLPFGLRNGSQTFQRFMCDNVLKDLDFVFAFIDDVMISSFTKEDHENHLRQVFQRSTDFVITINLNKCEFGKQAIEFLGYEVSTDGIKPLENKVKVILEYPKPETVEQLRRFLGMVNFYRANIPNATKYQSILNEFLKNSKKIDKTKINWSDKSVQAFEQCKLSLKEAVMLSHPVPNVPLSIMSDASDKFAGAVLQQLVNGKWLPLGYFSKKFTTAQQKYSTYDRELTAIYMAIKHFRYQFEGRELIIFTDHKPLTFAFNKGETSCETPKRTRQLLFISELVNSQRILDISKARITI